MTQTYFTILCIIHTCTLISPNLKHLLTAQVRDNFVKPVPPTHSVFHVKVKFVDLSGYLIGKAL